MSSKRQGCMLIQQSLHMLAQLSKRWRTQIRQALTHGASPAPPSAGPWWGHGSSSASRGCRPTQTLGPFYKCTRHAKCSLRQQVGLAHGQRPWHPAPLAATGQMRREVCGSVCDYDLLRDANLSSRPQHCCRVAAGVSTRYILNASSLLEPEGQQLK